MCFYFLIIVLITILSSQLAAQINRIKYPNPILTPGDSGALDDSDVSEASVLSLNDTPHLWYDANYGDENTGFRSSNPNGIGHAILIDEVSRINNFLNLILIHGPTAWESCWARQISVFYNVSDSLFHMRNAGRDNWNIYQSIYIGHATSTDGSNWIVRQQYFQY